MNGFERLKKLVTDQKDLALVQTVDYLLSRDDMESKYLNEEKNLKDMVEFIKGKARKHMRNGWNYITNEVVYAWAIMYFSFPNSFLKIKQTESKKETKVSQNNTVSKNNVINLEKAKEQIEKKKEVEQISLFGGGI